MKDHIKKQDNGDDSWGDSEKQQGAAKPMSQMYSRSPSREPIAVRLSKTFRKT